MKEREHKYLVCNDTWREREVSHIEITQGYLCRDPHTTVRVRLCGNDGFLTVKGITCGDTRDEFEYSIPYEDASEILKFCSGHVVRKIRHFVPFDGLMWEIDEFLGPHAPLYIAEVELPEDMQSWPLPSFAGTDVTGDPRYYNSNLIDLKNGID